LQVQSPNKANAGMSDGQLKAFMAEVYEKVALQVKAGETPEEILQGFAKWKAEL
jgi:hypothetical protein